MSFGVRIVQLPTTKVAAIGHRGPAHDEHLSATQLVAWRVRHGLAPDEHEMVTSLYRPLRQGTSLSCVGPPRADCPGVGIRVPAVYPCRPPNPVVPEDTRH